MTVAAALWKFVVRAVTRPCWTGRRPLRSMGPPNRREMWNPPGLQFVGGPKTAAKTGQVARAAVAVN